MPGGRPPSDEKQRFLSKVQIAATGCHEWQAAKNWQGYGKFYFRGHVGMPAHRAAYTLFVDEIPEGMCVCHRCDNMGCVNPDHLFLGSLQANIADMDQKGRRGTKSQLTREDAEEIKLLLSQRYSQQEVANRFGVHQTAISRIKLGKTTLFKEH